MISSIPGHTLSPNILAHDAKPRKICYSQCSTFFIGSRRQAQEDLLLSMLYILSPSLPLSHLQSFLSFFMDYTMSKNAVLGLIRSASLQLGAYGIRVNCVTSGPVVTPLLCSLFKVKAEDVAKMFKSHFGLYEMNRQPQRPTKQEVTTADSIKFESREANNKSTRSVKRKMKMSCLLFPSIETPMRPRKRKICFYKWYHLAFTNKKWMSWLLSKVEKNSVTKWKPDLWQVGTVR
ncbi:hypothetical protein COP2_035302 [Malus domestica]